MICYGNECTTLVLSLIDRYRTLGVNRPVKLLCVEHSRRTTNT